MKKLLILPALAVLLTATLAAGCPRSNNLEISTTRVYDSTRVTEESTALGERTTRRKNETATSLGDGISGALTEASEKLSEKVSEAGEKVREGATDLSETLSSAAKDIRD